MLVQVRNGRQGIYFKERMRRGETIVSFPRNLRLDEKTAMKGKAGHIFQRLKTENCYPDLLVILHREPRSLPRRRGFDTCGPRHGCIGKGLVEDIISPRGRCSCFR